MPRINIEDSIFRDFRFLTLIEKIGNKEEALGSLLLLWLTAQRYWRTGTKIPLPVFFSLKHSQLFLEVGLARQEGEFIYASGAQEQFSWLLTCSEKGRQGGVQSGKVRSNYYQNQLEPNRNEEILTNVEIIEEKTKGSSRVTKPLPLSLSLKERRRESDLEKSPLEAVSSLSLMGMLWNTYAPSELPRIRGESSGRRRHAETRWKEHPHEHYWKEVLLRISKSTFCLGKNDRQWKANYDWFLKPDTAFRVLEGAYDNQASLVQIKKVEDFL